jgi:hypothetical protein
MSANTNNKGLISGSGKNDLSVGETGAVRWRKKNRAVPVSKKQMSAMQSGLTQQAEPEDDVPVSAYQPAAITDDPRAMYESITDEDIQSMVGLPGDGALLVIAEKQGFTGLPELVDNLDDVPEGEHLYRGIGGDAAAQHADDFRSGPYFVGIGVNNGNGTYASTSLAEVEKYYADHPGSQVLHMALRPDARTITPGEISELQKAFHPVMKEMIEQDPDNRNRHLALQSIFADRGRFAAALGYDAIVAPPNQLEKRDAQHVVVLNRTALKVVR